MVRHACPPIVFSADHDRPIIVVQGGVLRPLTFEAALNSLGVGSRQVNITPVGDRRVCFDLLDFYHRQLTLFGVDSAKLDIVACGNILESLRPGFEDGRLTPPEIARTCSLDEVIEAHRQVADGTAKGKIVLTFKP
jgi:NADPH:quinone reductase-like Zn-dependent oxidoreductase